MALNRYDEVYTSTYNPRSLQETLMVPMMRRQQHDAANEKLQSQLGELNKINPLDKHYNEAQRIKSELTKQIDEQATQLATEGFNPNTNSNVFKTNRSIQDMYSPTGTVGQINAAKEAYDKDSAEYLKNSTALGHSPEVVKLNLQNIQDKYNRTPVYDEKGKVTSMSIDALPPKYIDHIARARDFFKDTGMSNSQIDNLASRMVAKPDGSGYVLTQGSKRGDSTNEQRLQDAVKFLNAEIFNPASDVGKSLKYNFKSPKEAAEDIKRMSPIYKKTSRERGFNSQISNLFDAPKPSGAGSESNTSSVLGVPMNTVEVGAKKEELDELDKIGDTLASTGSISSPLMMGTSSTYTPEKSGKFKYTDLSPMMSKRYKATFDRLKSSNKIHPNVSPNNKDVVKKIKSLIEQTGPITLTSNVITDNNIPNDLGFPGAISGKDSKEKTASVVRDLRYGTRKFIDPKSGESKTWNEMMEAGYKPETTSYYGYESAHTWKSSKFGAGEQNVSPHQITISDKNGKIYPTEISRTSNDGSKSDIQASNDLKSTYQSATIEPNEFVKFQSKNPKMKDIKVAYVTKDANGENLSEPVFMVKSKNGEPVAMPESKYMETVYKLYK